MTTRTEISNHSATAGLEPPRFENGKTMVIAGLRSRYVDSTMDTVSSQWLCFSVHIGNVPGQVDGKAYGLTFLGKGSPGIEYLTGVEVSGCAGLPAGFSCVSIPAQRYAVFPHRGHVSAVRETCEMIGIQRLPEWGQPVGPVIAGAPDFFERYTKDFNPQTGMGGIEIWIPIK